MKIRMSPATSQKRLVLAIHESAHAVAARSLGLGVRRIVMRGLKGMMYGRDDDRPPRNNLEMWRRFHEDTIVVAFAGPVAEYRVGKYFYFTDSDAEKIASCLREVLPHNHFVENAENGLGESWPEFYAILHTLATCSEQKRALTELDEFLDEFPELARIDMQVFHRLWPFAQQAQTIVNGNWSAVEEISKELIKNGRISGDNVEQIVSRQKGEES